MYGILLTCHGWPVQDEMLAQHVVCSHIRSHAEATAEEKSKRPKTQHASHLPPISNLDH